MKIGEYELTEACATCKHTRLNEIRAMYCATNNRERVEDFILPMCPLWELNEDLLYKEELNGIN